MKFQSIFRNLSGLVALALALVMGATIGFAQTADSEQISNLLKQAKRHAVLAEDDAAKLESYTTSKVSWQLHAAQLHRIREHINELGQLNKQLTDLRGKGSPWQQKAIDQIDPQLREMADLLTATIKHLNDNQDRVHMQPFRDYVKANAELTSRIASMIDDFVDYDEAKLKANSLEQRLELPAVASSF
jgi:hypothetical protein